MMDPTRRQFLRHDSFATLGAVMLPQVDAADSDVDEILSAFGTSGNPARTEPLQRQGIQFMTGSASDFLMRIADA